jgi:hypothetical protein
MYFLYSENKTSNHRGGRLQRAGPARRPAQLNLEESGPADVIFVLYWTVQRRIVFNNFFKEIANLCKKLAEYILVSFLLYLGTGSNLATNNLRANY